MSQFKIVCNLDGSELILSKDTYGVRSIYDVIRVDCTFEDATVYFTIQQFKDRSGFLMTPGMVELDTALKAAQKKTEDDINRLASEHFGRIQPFEVEKQQSSFDRFIHRLFGKSSASKNNLVIN